MFPDFLAYACKFYYFRDDRNGIFLCAREKEVMCWELFPCRFVFLSKERNKEII